MGLKSILAKPYAKQQIKKLKKLHESASAAQFATFKLLVKQGEKTAFGKDHNFDSIETYEDFKQQVPVRDYEGLKTYVERILNGESDVLWPGKPAYLCKTSGTTSGAKYIPLTKEAVPRHVDAAKLALLCYVSESKDASFLDGKMIFLQGSPELEKKGDIPLGRLSGITAHWVPDYLQKNRVPTWETNCISDWETKVDAIVDETMHQDLRLISGIPAWVQMYFERLIAKSGKKTIAEIFPNFSLFVYGGVNFEPYRPIFKRLIGKDIATVETYPASEGFIAFQDSQNEEGLLINLDAGIFYEFIPADTFFDENPPRLQLSEVEIGVNYAIILNTNAGLWGYNIGDTVKFVSTQPYRLIVTGRIKHFTSAFGEHVIAEEVESAMRDVLPLFEAEVREFHVAPQVNPTEGLPYHEWFIEFANEPFNMDNFKMQLDKKMQEKNPYYRDLLEGNILRPLVVSKIKNNGFVEMMKSRGKLGGQNKIPRLANDRSIADVLSNYLQ